MKQIRSLFLFLALAFAGATLSAQGGIDFFHGSFAEAQAMARQQGKLIFMDAYATWCGPCKWMSANTFPDERAGEFFNERFINLKIDMEKGEGPDLAQKFDVRAYPTLIFIDSDGEVVHQQSGARDVDGLIELGHAALEKAPDLDFVDPDAPIVVELPGDGGPVSPDPITPGPVDPGYGGQGGEALETALGQAIRSQDRSSFDRLSDDLLRSRHSNKHMVYLEAQKSWAETTGEVAQFRTRTHALMRNAPLENAELWNNAAWYFYELVEDRASLEQAAKWTVHSMRLSPKFYNFDTYAMLMHKLGDVDMAVIFARQAIALAQAEGSDASATERALEQMLSGI